MNIPKAKGSFRGVPFYTEGYQIKAGRRQQMYTPAFQDDGALGVDVGRAARKFGCTVYLLGENLDQQLSDLLEALETPGPGLLVHPDPVIGRTHVYVGDETDISRRTERQGVIEVSFRCTEAATQAQKTPSIDSASRVLSAAAKARAAAEASFSSPVTGLPVNVSDFVRAAHLDVLDSVIRDLRRVNGAIDSVLSVPGAFAEQLDTISREATRLIDTPGRLYRTLDGAAVQIAGALTRIVGADGREGAVTDERIDASTQALVNRARGSRGSLYGSITPMAGLGSNAPTVPSIDTADRRNQRQGQSALQRHAQAAGLIALSEAATALRYADAKDARAVRNALVAAVIALADSEPDLDTALSDALRDVAAAVQKFLTDAAGTAAEVTRYTPPDTAPIEVIAHVLYGDATRADEIEARNRQIAHIGMVLGQVDIEVATS